LPLSEDALQQLNFFPQNGKRNYPRKPSAYITSAYAQLQNIQAAGHICALVSSIRKNVHGNLNILKQSLKLPFFMEISWSIWICRNDDKYSAYHL
jgi:hypothetical protein